jgi:hypothetical protein
LFKRIELSLNTFLTSILFGSSLALAELSPAQKALYPLNRNTDSTRACLDILEKIKALCPYRDLNL